MLAVDENIMLPHLLDVHPKDQERLDKAVAEMGLMDRRDNLPSQLSGGQQQRVWQWSFHARQLFLQQNRIIEAGKGTTFRIRFYNGVSL